MEGAVQGETMELFDSVHIDDIEFGTIVAVDSFYCEFFLLFDAMVGIFRRRKDLDAAMDSGTDSFGFQSMNFSAFVTC